MARKSPKQLDREIAEALSRKPSKRHHATLRDVSDDAWDVARDAILEHDHRRAAKLWKQIRAEHGFVTAPNTFRDALREVPYDVRWKFEDAVAEPDEDAEAIHKKIVLSMKPGGKVVVHGQPGKVVRITPRETVEVRLSRGIVEVGPEDVQLT